MLKKLLPIIWMIFPVVLFGQTQTIVTGTVGGATSGYVEFRLQPRGSSVLFFVAGTQIIAPQTFRCSINSTGNIVATAGGNCLVWGNTVISPANTTYTLALAPGNTVSNTIPNICISGTTWSLSSPTFCPNVAIVPQFATITTPPTNTNIVPISNKVFNVGSAAAYYAAGYFDQLFTNNLNAPTSTITSSILTTTNLSVSGSTITPLQTLAVGKPGVLTLGTATGTLPADTYYVTVAAVDSLGLEGGIDPPSTTTIVLNGSQALTASWTAVPSASSYHVYVGRTADAYYRRFYSTGQTSLTITVAAQGPVATIPGNITVTPSNTGGNLRAGNYYFDIVATFSDGQTSDLINFMRLPVANISGADTGSVALVWPTVTGSINYRVYVATDYDGAARTHSKYFLAGNGVTSITVTGNETYATGAGALIYGNSDTLNSGVGAFSVIQTMSNAKSIFGGDIQIAGTSGTDAKFQANRYSNVTGSQAGIDFRTANTLYWNLYQGGPSEDLILANNTGGTSIDCIDPTNRCTFIGRTSFENPISVFGGGGGFDTAINQYGIRIEGPLIFGNGTVARGISLGPTIQAGGNNEVESALFVQPSYTNLNGYTGITRYAINSLDNNPSVLSGGLTVNTNVASGGVNTLVLNCIANNNCGVFNGSSTVGQSLGPQILAGTNSSDRAIDIENQSGGAILFRVRGDGQISVGGNIIPTADVSDSIGSTTNRIQNLFVGNYGFIGASSTDATLTNPYMIVVGNGSGFFASTAASAGTTINAYVTSGSSVNLFGGRSTSNGVYQPFFIGNAGITEITMPVAGGVQIGQGGGALGLEIAAPTGGMPAQGSINFAGNLYANNINVISSTGAITGVTYGSTTNCASPGGTCGSAPAGSVSIAAAATTVVVNTNIVGSQSDIVITFDEGLGGKLGVTCNSAAASEGATYFVSARTAGTSFTIKTNTAPTTNPACLNYWILN